MHARFQSLPPFVDSRVNDDLLQPVQWENEVLKSIGGAT